MSRCERGRSIRSVIGRIYTDGSPLMRGISVVLRDTVVTCDTGDTVSKKSRVSMGASPTSYVRVRLLDRSGDTPQTNIRCENVPKR